MTTDRNSEGAAWPERMVNMPDPNGSSDRIIGFRVPDGDPILGEYGLSEPLAWFRQVTVDRPATIPSAEVQALVERLRTEAIAGRREASMAGRSYDDRIGYALLDVAEAKTQIADELAKLIPRNPE